MRYYCSYSSTSVHFKISMPYCCSRWRRIGRRCPENENPLGSSRFQALDGVPCRQVVRSITLPDNRPPLISIHLEPPSTACPYPGTAYSNRPKAVSYEEIFPRNFGVGGVTKFPWKISSGAQSEDLGPSLRPSLMGPKSRILEI